MARRLAFISIAFLVLCCGLLPEAADGQFKGGGVCPVRAQMLNQHAMQMQHYQRQMQYQQMMNMKAQHQAMQFQRAKMQINTPRAMPARPAPTVKHTPIVTHTPARVVTHTPPQVMIPKHRVVPHVETHKAVHRVTTVVPHTVHMKHRVEGHLPATGRGPGHGPAIKQPVRTVHHTTHTFHTLKTTHYTTTHHVQKHKLETTMHKRQPPPVHVTFPGLKSTTTKTTTAKHSPAVPPAHTNKLILKESVHRVKKEVTVAKKVTKTETIDKYLLKEISKPLVKIDFSCFKCHAHWKTDLQMIAKKGGPTSLDGFCTPAVVKKFDPVKKPAPGPVAVHHPKPGPGHLPMAVADHKKKPEPIPAMVKKVVPAPLPAAVRPPKIADAIPAAVRPPIKHSPDHMGVHKPGREIKVTSGGPSLTRKPQNPGQLASGVVTVGNPYRFGVSGNQPRNVIGVAGSPTPLAGVFSYSEPGMSPSSPGSWMTQGPGEMPMTSASANAPNSSPMQQPQTRVTADLKSPNQPSFSPGQARSDLILMDPVDARSALSKGSAKSPDEIELPLAQNDLADVDFDGPALAPLPRLTLLLKSEPTGSSPADLSSPQLADRRTAPPTQRTLPPLASRVLLAN